MNKHILFLEISYSFYVVIVIIGYPLLIVFSLIRALYRCLKSHRKSIEGEVALITGSGRGLGREIAISLAKRGCLIAIVDIQGDLAKNTAEYIAMTYGVKTQAYEVDITDYEQLLDLQKKVSQDLGDVTILINNAGIITLSSFENPPAKEIQRMINVNYLATVYTTQIFLPRIKQINRGHIVNISSLTAIVPCHLYMIYAGTKAAVRQFTSSLRIDFLQSSSNITATTMLPTYISSNERIHQLMNLTGAEWVVPGAHFDAVADYTIKAMLRGDDEVSVPSVFLYHHRLMGLFTTYITEKVIAIFTKGFWDKREREDVKHFLTPDIPTNF